MNTDALTCPKCGSDLVTTGTRGLTQCLACGQTTDTTKER